VSTPNGIQADMAEARAELGKGVWTAAFTAGRALSLEESIAETLEDIGWGPA
jgi:hypothetical protein